MKLGARLVLIGLMLAGCGDDDDDGGSSADRTAKVVAASLTSNVLFADGVVQTGDIPATSASTVSLRQEDQVLSLGPGDAQVLALEVDNPDEADDPVVATLMQFEGDEDSHVEVERKSGGDGGTSDAISIEFDVDDDVCADLCNETFTLTMIQAVKLESGKISKHLKRTVKLDCTDDGDPDKCEKDEPSGGKGGGSSGRGGSSGGGSGGSGGGSVSPTTLGEEFARALGLANTALCRCPEYGMTMGAACKAMLPQPAVACIQAEAIDAAEDSAAAGMLGSLTGKLNAAIAACQSCDLTTCDPELLADALETLPADVATAFETCASDANGMIGGYAPMEDSL